MSRSRLLSCEPELSGSMRRSTDDKPVVIDPRTSSITAIPGFERSWTACSARAHPPSSLCAYVSRPPTTRKGGNEDLEKIARRCSTAIDDDGHRRRKG